MNTLKTGDLLLFTPKKYNTWFEYLSSFIKYPKETTYTDIGMIIKDPIFIDSTLKGLYLWTIEYETIKGIQNIHINKIKPELQIVPLHEIINKNIDYRLIIRKVKCNYMLFNNFKLNEINTIVNEDIYDCLNMVDCLDDTNNKPIYKCLSSSLIGYIYTKCGLLKQNTDWSELTPNDFSLRDTNLFFEENCTLDNTLYEVNIKKL